MASSLGDLEGGADLPEIKMLFSLIGTAELNLGIARAGVGGGIDATITSTGTTRSPTATST